MSWKNALEYQNKFSYSFVIVIFEENNSVNTAIIATINYRKQSNLKI